MFENVSVVTLGVNDFPGSFRFYRDILELKTESKETDPIAFFRLKNLILAIFPRKELALDANTDHEGSGFHGFTLAHNVPSESEVDIIIEKLRARGTQIVKEPRKADWGGYSAYFSDPDGFLWEIAYNPGFKTDGEGKIIS